MIIGIEEAMQITGLGRKTITRYLNTKGCPVLPRRKGQNYQIPKESFIKWLETRTK